MPDERNRRDRGKAPKETGGGSSLRGWSLFSALIAVAVYAAMVAVLVLSASSEEVVWSRLVYVFASIQALAFAAAGALWGTTVSQARIERAERSADENARDANNGRALASAILAEPDAVSEADSDRSYRGRLPNGTFDQTAVRHALLASRLFPSQAASPDPPA